MSFGRFHTDGALAFTLLVFSVTFSVLQYGSLLQLERPESPVDGIPVGERHFQISSHGMCIGGIEFLAYEGDEYEISSRGLVRVRYDAKEYEVRLSLTTAFNSFGQLAAALLRFESDDFDIKLGLREVNPIHFDLIARVKDKVTRHRHLFPGPLLALPQGDDHIQFRYRFAPVEVASSRSQMLAPLLTTLDLDSEEFEGKAPEDLTEVCREETPGHLSLDLFAERLRGLFSLFLGGAR